MFHPDSLLLRRALWADALLSGASAAMLVAAPAALAQLMALPEALLLHAGQFLVAWTAVLVWMLLRPGLNVIAVSAVIAVNLIWVVDCAWLLGSDRVAPNALGQAYLLLHVVSVGALALVQTLGLTRRQRAVA